MYGDYDKSTVHAVRFVAKYVRWVIDDNHGYEYQGAGVCVGCNPKNRARSPPLTQNTWTPSPHPVIDFY